MTKQVQRRRGTATQHTSFTGAEGELSVNTTNKSVHVHDNVTAGGFEAARADMDNVTSSSILTAAGITATTAELNYVDGVTSNIQTQLDGKAGTASPTFTGTLTTANLTATGTTTLAGASTSADITFGDNDKAIFGAGSDLQIYSDGTNGYIEEAGGGNLRIITNGPSVAINKGTVGGENMAVFNADGAVQLFYDNSQKIATTSTGIDVTGTVTADGLTVEGTAASTLEQIALSNNNSSFASGLKISASFDSDNEEYGNLTWTPRNGTQGYFQINNLLGGSLVKALEIDGNDISFYEDTGTTAKFFWDASAERLDIGGGNSNAVLDVLGSSLNDWALRAENTEGTGQGWGALIVASANTSAEKAFEVRKNTSDTAMLINGLGNVGIGTSSVSALLHIKGANPEYRIEDNNETGSANIVFRDSARETAKISVASGVSANMQFQTLGLERMRIDSSGNVGIGTSSPSAKLHLKQATDNAFNGIKIERSTTSNQYSVLSSAQGTTYLAGVDLLGAGNNVLSFGNSTNGTTYSEAMRIDSSGNLLVGKTTTASSTQGIAALASGSVVATATSDFPLLLNRISTDGDIAVFRKDGSTVGSIGAFAGDFIVGSSSGSDAAFRMDGANNAIYASNTAGAARDAAIDLGASTVRWKDLYLSGGVYLGGTGAANKLDDYEEGTWTPNIEGSSTSGAATFTSRSGTYTKIGRQVHVTFEWVLTNHTGSGIMDIIGLPFAPAGPTGTEYTGNIMVYQMDITVDNPISLSVYASQGASRLRIYGSRDNGTWIAQNIETANTVIGSITYFA